MAGVVPAIPVLLSCKKVVDARRKAGHDGALFLLLREHLSRLPERVDTRGDARVDRHVDEYLADLLLGQPIGERAADVQLQLVRPVEDRDHREIEHRALLLAQALAAPAGAPAVLADKLLERPVEVVRVLHRALDILLAEHFGADAQSGLVSLLVHGNVLLVFGSFPMSDYPGAAWLARYRSQVNGDAELKVIGDWFTTTFALTFGDSRYAVQVEKGRITDIVTPKLDTRTPFGFRAPVAVWRQFLSPNPPPLFHDFFAMLMRVPEFVLEGDSLVAMQNARALHRMMNIMRETGAPNA